MPTPPPPISPQVAAVLAALGERLRSHRKRLGVSAATAAEAAGISRVTLHRVERGEPSVAMGSYGSVAVALGLALRLVDPQQPADDEADPANPLPARLALADYPQLRRLAWQRDDAAEIDPREALALYERNWRHVDRQALDAQERALLAVASKLLANSDRWRDDAVCSRDLIDLAMMKPSKALLRRAVAKAQAAYGDSIQADLASAIERLRTQPHHLARCMAVLGMHPMPQALVWKHIRALAI